MKPTTPRIRNTMVAVLLGCLMILPVPGQGQPKKSGPAQAVRPRDARKDPAIPQPAVKKRPVPVRPRVAALQPGGGIDTLILADRETVRRLELAKQLVAKKQFVQSITLLQLVLDRAKDAFYYPDPEKRDVLQSVRNNAQKLIAGLPEQGRKLYQLKSGGEALRLLEESVKTGQVDKLQEATRRFFHTTAGYEAMYRLAVYHLDRSQPLAAAFCFERLREIPRIAKQWEPLLTLQAAVAWQRAGLPAKSKTLLDSFRKTAGGDTIVLGGKKIRPFASADEAYAWLEQNFGKTAVSLVKELQWAVFRGNSSRNGIAALPEKAGQTAWHSTTITDPLDPSIDQREKVDSANIKELKSHIASLKAANNGQKTPALPKPHPLVIDDLLVIRTTGCLRAVDIANGSRVWETVPDITMWSLMSSDGETPVANPSSLVNALLKQRLWGDLSWGTLASDGHRIYAIEESGYAYSVYDPKSRTRMSPTPHNRLVAYDARTGRIAWWLGGKRIDSLVTNPMAGMYFLSPPLPLGNQLYCLAEENGEVRLIALEHREEGSGRKRKQSAELLWSQPLVGAQLRITQDWRRRTSAASVSYADGVMVCCTDAGYVIAVDLTSRTLLWAYRYAHQQVVRPPFPRPRPVPPQQQSQWADFTATIADGKVILTPRGAGEMVCLKLMDGSKLWTKKQDNGRYVAGVVDGKVLIVDSNAVRALKLDDGKTAWKKPTSLPALSGRGIIAGNRLFLPCGSEGVCTIDVADGKVLKKTKLPDGRTPGNLVVYKGTLISQEVDSIDAIPLPLDKAVEKKIATR